MCLSLDILGDNIYVALLQHKLQFCKVLLRFLFKEHGADNANAKRVFELALFSSRFDLVAYMLKNNYATITEIRNQDHLALRVGLANTHATNYRFVQYIINKHLTKEDITCDMLHCAITIRNYNLLRLMLRKQEKG